LIGAIILIGHSITKICVFLSNVYIFLSNLFSLLRLHHRFSEFYVFEYFTSSVFQLGQFLFLVPSVFPKICGILWLYINSYSYTFCCLVNVYVIFIFLRMSQWMLWECSMYLYKHLFISANFPMFSYASQNND